MKKKLIFTCCFVVIVFIAGFIYFNTYETTPIMKDVKRVYIDFVVVDEDGEYVERKIREIADASDRDYLINFFNNRFNLDASFGCMCTKNDVLINFETDYETYTFGLGVGMSGDPQMYYYNRGRSCEFTEKQREELFGFISKFEETSNYIFVI